MLRAIVLIVVALAILLLIVVNHASHTTQEHQATGPEVSALTTQPKPAVEERKLPTEETLFISTVNSYRTRYGEALNEFQKSAVRKERATALARVLPGRSAEDWIGEISSMTTTSDGEGSLSVRLPGSNPPIAVKTWNNGLSDIGSGTLIPSGSPLYEQVAHLATGNKVIFGGTFSSGNLDYMREASLTEAGSMTEPEFIFTFTSIRLETATPTQPSSLATTANNAAPPADTATPIDNAHVQDLIKERNATKSYIELLASYLNAPSFAERAQIYCRELATNFMGNPTERYAQLMRSAPATREEELKRQYELLALREAMAAYNKNVSDCRGMVVNGFQKLPTDEELRAKVDQERQHIAEIDQELAHPQFSSTVLDSAEPKPNSIAMTQGSPAALPSQSPVAVALNNRGVARQDKGDLDGAIQDYSEAIRLKPDYAIAFLSRGTARRVKGDLDGAIQDDNEAIHLKPDDANSFGERGIARRAKGDLEGAVRDFSEAIRLKPNDAKVFVYRGEARLAKSDIDGAIQDFNAAIGLRSDYAESFSDRGVARQNKGDLDGAIQDYSQAIRLKPDYAIAFDNRGTARQLKGDLDGAIQDFSEAIRLKPDYARAFHDRGATRARKGDAAGAQQDNSRAVQLGWH
jgi:tetratricopeptide (TPR) repeat protein